METEQLRMHLGPKARYQLLKCGVTALALLVSPLSLYAQSCALCYQTAANSGTHFIQALKHGILILLFPPLSIGTIVAIVAYRKRNQYAEDWQYGDEHAAVLGIPAVNAPSGRSQSLVGFATGTGSPKPQPDRKRNSAIETELRARQGAKLAKQRKPRR